jgi:hypothetical protein
MTAASETVRISAFARALILARQGDVDGAIEQLPLVNEKCTYLNPLIACPPAFAAAAIIRALPEFQGYRIGEVLSRLRANPSRTAERVVALAALLHVETPTEAIEMALAALAGFDNELERIKGYLGLAAPLDRPRRDLLVDRALLAASAQQDNTVRDKAYALVAEWLIVQTGDLSHALDVCEQIRDVRLRLGLVCHIAVLMRAQGCAVLDDVVNKAHALACASGDLDLMAGVATLLNLELDGALADALASLKATTRISP